MDFVDSLGAVAAAQDVPGAEIKGARTTMGCRPIVPVFSFRFSLMLLFPFFLLFFFYPFFYCSLDIMSLTPMFAQCRDFFLGSSSCTRNKMNTSLIGCKRAPQD